MTARPAQEGSGVTEPHPDDGDSLPVDDIDGELDLMSVRVREVLVDGPISEDEKQGMGATKKAMHKVKGEDEDGGSFDLKPWR